MLVHSLAARGESPAAFGGRGILSGGGAPRSNMPNILPRHALPARRLAHLGATRDFHHGLLAAALLVIVALGCGPHDPEDPSAETPSPTIVASPPILAEAETSWNADYLSGFHPREANQAETWRWTLNDAAMRFRNPRADALLHLTVRGRSHVFDTPQTVAVRIGDQTVDSFVASGAITTRTVALGRELMGGSDSFIVEILVDKTFVPASVPGSASLDSDRPRAGDSRRVGSDRAERPGASPEGTPGDARDRRDRAILSMDAPAGLAVRNARCPRLRGRAAPCRWAAADGTCRHQRAHLDGSIRDAGVGGWFNNRRLLEPIDVPPAEFEAHSTGGRSMSSFWKRTASWGLRRER